MVSASWSRPAASLAALIAALALAAPVAAQQAAAPAAPGAAPEAAPQGPAPVRVISLGGLTAAAAGVAADLMAARELAALEVNAGGGLADGAPLALEPVDVGCAGDEADAAGSVAAQSYEAAAAVAFLGPVCSDAALSAAEAAIALGAPLISDGATTPALSALEDGDLVFRTAAVDTHAAEALVELAQRRRYASVAVAHGDDAWGQGLAEAFAGAARAAGIEVRAMQGFSDGDDDYTDDMRALAGIGAADALALFAYAGGGGEAALKAALREGAWGAVIGGDGLLDDAVARSVGTLNLTRVTLVAPAPDRGLAAWSAFAEAARAQGLDPAAPLAAQGYDAAMVLALALVRSGGEGGAALAAAIREVTAPGAPQVLPGDWARAKRLAAQGPVRYMGASGPLGFDAAGDARPGFAAWRAHAGSWRPGPLR
ncbi:ABC transporter substrate-binding protein [Rhodovulum sp. DZ06]|uniref:ABC transporter substrate-binding protein n=1 Tax=Rhodovulum sp. DZ06 TaxID=3425126 RepID=UPI003D341D27